MQAEIWYGLGALVLVLVLAYATFQSRSSNRRNDPVTEAATKELYQNPDTYDAKREELKQELEPQHKGPGSTRG